MKSILKKVYYCDFCKKRGLAKYAMEVHEKHCTANPNRECRTCAGGHIVDVIENLKARFTLSERTIDLNEIGVNMDSHEVHWLGQPVTLNEISEIVDHCPNCILSVLRQTGMNRHYFHFEFNYKAELSQWMAEKQNSYDHQ